jgi:hypothetical protein
MQRHRIQIVPTRLNRSMFPTFGSQFFFSIVFRCSIVSRTSRFAVPSASLTLFPLRNCDFKVLKTGPEKLSQ